MLAEDPVVFPALPSLGQSHGGAAAFGIELFQEHLLVFELVSVLILVGIIGAVHLSIRHRRPSPEEPPEGENAGSSPSSESSAEEAAHV
jgi:hypothetical protein